MVRIELVWECVSAGGAAAQRLPADPSRVHQTQKVTPATELEVFVKGVTGSFGRRSGRWPRR